MNNLDIIFKRGSIRRFKNKNVNDDDIKTILEAGFAAPSALNKRPYHFIIIKDRELMNKISETSIGKRVLKGADFGIAVLGDLNINDKYEFVMNDTSAAIENMLLTIDAIGLGGCWLGQRRDHDEIVNKLLNLPKNVFVSGFIAVGYKDEIKIQSDRYDESKIHYNKW